MKNFNLPLSSTIAKAVLFIVCAALTLSAFGCKPASDPEPTPTHTQPPIAPSATLPQPSPTATLIPATATDTPLPTLEPTRTPPPSRTPDLSPTPSPYPDDAAPGYHTIKVTNLHFNELHMYVDGVYLMTIPPRKYLTYNAIKEGWHLFQFTKLLGSTPKDIVSTKELNITSFTEITVSP